MTFKSIVSRLTAWYSVTLFGVILVVAGLLYLSLTKILDAEGDSLLRDRIEAVSLILNGRDRPLLHLRERIESEWAVRRFERTYVKVVDDRGDVLASSPQTPPGLAKNVFSRVSGKDALFADSPGTRVDLGVGQSYLVIAKRVTTPNPAVPAVTVYAALDLSLENDILSRYRGSFFIILAASLMIVAFLGHRFASLSFGPVRKIIDATNRITGATINDRIETENLPVELVPLAATINSMAERLGESLERLSRFSSDIAHELRTPINNIRGEVEVSMMTERSPDEYREVLSSVLEEFTRISAMIDSLLFLARTENTGMEMKSEKFNPSEEVGNILDYYGASAAEEGITIRTDLRDCPELYGEKTLFQRAVSNLVSNAINYSSRGGTILVSTALRDKSVALSVEDTGRGIPKSDLSKIFDRFYRGDLSRSATKLGGFGLGLTIVKSVMALYGGTVKIESEEGRGTKVSLEFPLEGGDGTNDDKNVISGLSSRKARPDILKSGMRRVIGLSSFFALNLFVCFAVGAAAEERPPAQFTWTLQDVVRIASEQNPDIKSALANFEAASKGIMVATSGVLPRVDVSSSYEETTLPSPSAGLSAQLGTALPYGSAVASLSQLVYDFGKTLNEIASSKALSNAAEQQAEAVRIAVALAAERAFYDVEGAEELVLVARQGVAEFEETRRRIELMVRAKARPSFDLSQASVELSQAKLGLIKAVNDKDIAKIFLLNILGMSSHVAFNLKGAEPSRMIDADKLNVEKLTNMAMDKRPEIKRRDFELDSAKARLLREQGSFYPSVSVGGWYGQFYGRFPSTIDNAWGGGLTLEWNIFEGYKTTGRVGESMARINETAAVLDKQKLSISAEVAKGVMDLKRQGSALLVARENLENARENARLAKLRYDANVATFLELLIAQTTLLSAEAQDVRARYDYEVAVATLRTAVGGRIE